MMLLDGCACGAVRYRLDAEPFDAGYCHCELCRRSSGAPVLSFATIPVESFILTHGQPAKRKSSSFGKRWFCNGCRTQLATRVDYQPDTIDFTIASLDDPAAVAPDFHIWFNTRISWFDTADSFARHAKFRPNPKGLQ